MGTGEVSSLDFAIEACGQAGDTNLGRMLVTVQVLDATRVEAR
jgi:hypothetical protein